MKPARDSLTIDKIIKIANDNKMLMDTYQIDSIALFGTEQVTLLESFVYYNCFCNN